MYHIIRTGVSRVGRSEATGDVFVVLFVSVFERA
jgi:hypothetical protein